jgi:hypothetical protein
MTVAGTAVIKKSKKNGLPGTMLAWKEEPSFPQSNGGNS